MESTINARSTISFVIPALNEEENIVRLLDSINRQEKPDSKFQVEIIVADNGSTDRTVELGKRNGATVVVEPSASIGALRNRGTEIAKGYFLVFCDADNVLSEGVIEQVILRLSCSDIGAVSPDGLMPYGKATWVERAWYWHTCKTKQMQELREVDFLGSGFLALRKEVFEEVKGFDEKLDVGEDSDLSRRIRGIGYRLVQDRNLRVSNTGHPKTLWQLIRRESWHGDSLRNVRIHKSIDLLTVYLLLIAISMATIFLWILRLIGIKWMAIPVGLIVVPSFVKAFYRRGTVDRLFWQLIVIYCTYLLSRSLALFKKV
jgi:glycosyltransferase involved in cell wall biosynthesis